MRPDSKRIIKSIRRRRGEEEDDCAKPFFKWAGGKSQLLEAFESRLPEGLYSGSLNRYVEPFIGGGAVFFLIAQLFPLKEAVICDVNKELILAYTAVKKDVSGLISRLKEYQEQYDGLIGDQRMEMFYTVRNTLNADLKSFNYESYSDEWTNRAAELLFLNKTCFNGLYRVNSKGEFNVPFGKYNNPNVVHEENLRKVSDLLQNTTIILGDFSRCREFIDEKTFVYCDPPYRPLNKSSTFTSYSEDGFSDQDQVRLCEFYREVDKAGAKVMLSNSDPRNEDPEDHFFDDLYKDYLIERVPAKRMINSNGEKRGAINELIIRNYGD